MTRFEPEQEAAIVALVSGLPDRQLVCIGASALRHHIELERRTFDVDFAIRARPDELDELVVPLGFVPDETTRHRFAAPNGRVVDLVPYDDVALGRGYVDLEDGYRLSVVGFDLLDSHRTIVALATDSATVAVAELPAIIVLKIVAYLDRPHQRERDLDDLNAIFTHVLGPDDERRWEEPLLSAGVDHEHQGAFLMGAQVGALLRADHRVRVDAFLDIVGDRTRSDFFRMIRSTPFGADRERFLVDRLAAFGAGLARLATRNG